MYVFDKNGTLICPIKLLMTNLLDRSMIKVNISGTLYLDDTECPRVLESSRTEHFTNTTQCESTNHCLSVIQNASLWVIKFNVIVIVMHCTTDRALLCRHLSIAGHVSYIVGQVPFCHLVALDQPWEKVSMLKDRGLLQYGTLLRN